MKKKLLKRCQKPICGNSKEKSMLLVGKTMFDGKPPKKEIPMHQVRCNGKSE